jgi:hypothetical protein
MAFPDDVVVQAWKRSGGKCECKGWKHNHKFARCNAQLIPAMRGQGQDLQVSQSQRRQS